MIIGLLGLINSGKNTVADYLICQYNFRQISFASTLKDCLSIIFSWDRTKLEGLTHEDREWRNQIDHWWADRLNIPHLSPRWVMQYWGTNVCRDHFHNDIWIASLENKLGKITSDIIVTDCRFKNELALIKKLNGILVRVKRGDDPAWFNDAILINNEYNYIEQEYNAAKHRLHQQNIHQSESDWVGTKIDITLNNSTSFADLHKQIDDLMSNYLP